MFSLALTSKYLTSSLRAVSSASLVETYVFTRLLGGIFRGRPCCRQGCRVPGLEYSYIVVALLFGFGEAGDGLVESGFAVDGKYENESVLAVCPEVVECHEDLLT